jgi:hypothetical protein
MQPQAFLVAAQGLSITSHVHFCGLNLRNYSGMKAQRGDNYGGLTNLTGHKLSPDYSLKDMKFQVASTLTYVEPLTSSRIIRDILFDIAE